MCVCVCVVCSLFYVLSIVAILAFVKKMSVHQKKKNEKHIHILTSTVTGLAH